MIRTLGIALVLGVAGVAGSALSSPASNVVGGVQLERVVVKGVVAGGRTGTLEGAVVVLFDAAGNEVGVATTDANGEYGIVASPGIYKVNAKAEGCGDQSERVDASVPGVSYEVNFEFRC